MKRRASIRIDVELEADTPTGMDDAAMEALSQIKCDSFIDCGDGHYQSVKLIEKSFVCQDEHLLLELVLKATGVSSSRFIAGRKWPESQARNMFAFFAQKYFEWSHNQIANFLRRDRSTVSTGVKRIISVLSRTPDQKHKFAKGDGKARMLRSNKVIEAMALVQLGWNKVKE